MSCSSAQQIKDRLEDGGEVEDDIKHGDKLGFFFLIYIYIDYDRTE